MFQCGCDFVARGVQALGGCAQDAGAGVFGAVDAVSEAHELVLAVEDAFDEGAGVVVLLDFFDHREDAGGCAAVQWAGHGADGSGECGGDVGAGGGDDAGGEGGGVEAVFGGGDPVGVDGFGVRGVGVAFPAGHEACGDGFALVDLLLRHRWLVDAACRLCDVGQCHDRGAGELVAGGGVVDVEQGLVAPDGGEHGQAGLDVDADVAGVDGERERLGRWESWSEAAVDEQCPDVAEGDVFGDEVFDVDAAVAQRAAVLVRLGDVGGERDDAFETTDEIFGNLLYSHDRRTLLVASRLAFELAWSEL